MKYKIEIQEERRLPVAGEPYDVATEMVTVDEITSENPKVIAGFLRAKADQLDPSEKAYRG